MICIPQKPLKQFKTHSGRFWLEAMIYRRKACNLDVEISRLTLFTLTHKHEICQTCLYPPSVMADERKRLENARWGLRWIQHSSSTTFWRHLHRRQTCSLYYLPDRYNYITAHLSTTKKIGIRYDHCKLIFFRVFLHKVAKKLPEEVNDCAKGIFVWSRKFIWVASKTSKGNQTETLLSSISLCLIYIFFLFFFVLLLLHWEGKCTATLHSCRHDHKM